MFQINMLQFQHYRFPISSIMNIEFIIRGVKLNLCLNFIKLIFELRPIFSERRYDTVGMIELRFLVRSEFVKLSIGFGLFV